MSRRARLNGNRVDGNSMERGRGRAMKRTRACPKSPPFGESARDSSQILKRSSPVSSRRHSEVVQSARHPARILHGSRLALNPGARLGPYEILSSLGAGGMGEVYRARDTKLNRDVAIKVLPDSFASRRRPAGAVHSAKPQTLASLNHPNIARDLRSGGSRRCDGARDGTGRGADACRAHRARARFRSTRRCRSRKQIAEALEAAHEQGIIHRDLKPGQHQGAARRHP